MNSVHLGEIVAALGGELRGDPETSIACIAPLETAGGDALLSTFVDGTEIAELTSELAAAAARAGARPGPA